MAWLWWLSGPVIAGSLAALWTWWAERPRRRPNTRGAIRAHDRYLDTLIIPAAGPNRAEGFDSRPAD